MGGSAFGGTVQRFTVIGADHEGKYGTKGVSFRAQRGIFALQSLRRDPFDKLRAGSSLDSG